MVKKAEQYRRIIEYIFDRHYREGLSSLDFERDEIEEAARELGLRRPKNLGDVVYSFRHRRPLPETIADKAPKGTHWIIRSAGTARYRFVAVPQIPIEPSPLLAVTKVPDSTPGVIAKYALSDEQALLAKLRYNRLLDIFTGVTCYSLQSHLRTQVDGNQVETDEVYVGIDRRGMHYVFPIQAKGRGESLSLVQIENDFAMCQDKFDGLVCRPVGATFMPEDVIVLFEFEMGDEGIAVGAERHYRLVPPDEVTPEDLQRYSRPAQ